MLWGERICFFTFSSFWRLPAFLGCGPFIQQCSAESSSHCRLSDPFSHSKAYCDYSGPTQINQPNLPNLSAQLISNLDSFCNVSFSLICSLIYSQKPGIRLWTSLGGHYPAYHIILSMKGFIITRNKRSRSKGLQGGSGCATPSYTRFLGFSAGPSSSCQPSLGTGCDNGCILSHCRNNHLQLKQPRAVKRLFLLLCLFTRDENVFKGLTRRLCLTGQDGHTTWTHHVSPS